MKISLNWLTDYVDVDRPATELAEVLANLGLPVEEIIETDTDIVLDVEITSNRPDCLGHLGLAREVATATGKEFRAPQIGDLPAEGDVNELTSVTVDAPDLCPRYTARVIRGVKVGPSPDWLVERLEAVGLRSVNNIVDVTNYVLMEYSQPLHSFDYDKLAGHKIIVRRAKDGETLKSIDETECKLTRDMLVIADAEKPVAVAGIMGGLDTEVIDATVNVLIESAQFDPLTTRRTSRALQLMSDSNYRFERGIDPVGVDEASRRACQLILELAGGTLADGVVDVWATPYQAPAVTLRPQRTNAILGFEISPERQFEILQRLGLRPENKDGCIVCTIPPYRATDLTREIDLIEEIGRVRGLDNVPVYHKITHAVVGESMPQKLRRELIEALTAGGFDEAVTFAFIDHAEAKLFGCDEPMTVDSLTRKTNNTLRPTILPSLLGACKHNQDVGNTNVSLFEIGSVFPPGKSELPDEHAQVAMVSTCPLNELRGVLEDAVSRVVADAELKIVPTDVPGFAAGAAGQLHLNGETVGVFGMLSSEVQDHYGLEKPVAMATLRFEALLKLTGRPRVYHAIPKYPAVHRDLSVVVDETVTWQQLAEAVADVAQPLRREINYVTTYRGKPIPSGKKSVTLALTYRDDDGTLRGQQVDEQVVQVVASLQKKLSAELRAQ